MIDEMSHWLCTITGFKAMSFQPNSGAAGEYAGLTVIRNYLHHIGQGHRNICLIPASAHGTNPASSAKAGFQVCVVKSTEDGEIDVNDLREKAEANRDNLACLMITYPSTHGVFEEAVLDIIKIVHENGGQVYMDGANMNAQVGLTSPGTMGADVCHLNLHKTFAMPRAGGEVVDENVGVGAPGESLAALSFAAVGDFGAVRTPDSILHTAERWDRGVETLAFQQFHSLIGFVNGCDEQVGVWGTINR